MISILIRLILNSRHQGLAVPTFAVALVVSLLLTGCTKKKDASPLTRLTATEVFQTAKTNGAQLTLVNVWATWCDPCKAEMPELVSFHKAFKEKGVRVMLVSADSAEDEQAAALFLKQSGVDFPAFILGESPASFLKSTQPDWNGGLPATFIIDSKGQIKKFWVGASTRQSLEERVAPWLHLQGPKK